VHINSQARIFTDEGAGSTGMIQVDVCQKESVKIDDAQTVNGEVLAEMGNRGRWPGINQCHSVAGSKQGRGDGAGMASPVQIQNGCVCHKRNSVAQKGVAKSLQPFLLLPFRGWPGNLLEYQEELAE
jgi:hypothetical protein